MMLFFKRHGQFLAGIVATVAVGGTAYLMMAPKEVEAAGGKFVVETSVNLSINSGDGVSYATVLRFVDTEKRTTCYISSNGGLSCLK